MSNNSDPIRQAFDQAEEIFAPNAGGADDMPPEVDDQTPEARCALIPLNDFGNSMRLVFYFGEDMLFAPRVGWFCWTSKVWKQDEDKIKVRALAQRVAEKIIQEVPYVVLDDWERTLLEGAIEAQHEISRIKEKGDITDEDKARIKSLSPVVDRGSDIRSALASRKKAHRTHGRAAGNTSSISNMLTEAQVSCVVDIVDMNADPLAINTRSGVLRLRSSTDEVAASFGETRETWGVVVEPHAREQLMSKMMPVDYDPAATCPMFDKFLAAILPDPSIREFLQRWFGYSLTGLTTEQKLAFFHGGGRNGKSTLVDLIAYIMAEYATTVPIESLTGDAQRKGSDATPDLVRIPGARMVRASEPEQGQKMKEALVKALTGGEPILIRRMQQEFIEVTPEFKLTISGNHKPEIRGGDDGIWRRVLLVPFEVQIAREDVDPLLPQKLRSEVSGIFNWLIEGALKYMTDGLQEPEIVTEATKAYREESDPLRTFFKEECEITGSDDDYTLARDLVDAFRLFLERRGDDPWGKRTVSNQIRARAGMEKHHETGLTFSYVKRSDSGYLGIRLRPEIIGHLAYDRQPDFAR